MENWFRGTTKVLEHIAVDGRPLNGIDIGVRRGNVKRARRGYGGAGFHASRNPAPCVQVADIAPKRIGRRIDGAGRIEVDDVLERGIEISGRSLQSPAQECLVDTRIEPQGVLRGEPRIAVDGIPVNRIVAYSKSLEERGRAVAAAGMRANLGAAFAEKICQGAIAGVRGGRRRESHVLIRRGSRGAKRGSVQGEKLRSNRPRNLQPAVEEPSLVLREYRMAQLRYIHPGRGQRIAQIGVVIGVVFAFELITF